MILNTRSNKLGGKVAVMTGASKGMGAAIAKHLAAEGAAVVADYYAGKVIHTGSAQTDGKGAL